MSGAVYEHRRLLFAAALLLLLTLLAAASSALAPHAAHAYDPCGDVVEEGPNKDANLGRPPIAIGDSPMLLATPLLANKGFLANAHGCRQYSEGLRVLKDYKKKGKLGRIVVIALGSNGVVQKSQIHKALKIIGKKRLLLLVAQLELGGGESSDTELARKEARKHRRIRLLDWARYSRGHGSWFQSDGLHPTLEGAEKMADFYADLTFHILAPPKHHG
jgi:hypothetical protein